jgi:hypothetical protein
MRASKPLVPQHVPVLAGLPQSARTPPVYDRADVSGFPRSKDQEEQAGYAVGQANANATNRSATGATMTKPIDEAGMPRLVRRAHVRLAAPRPDQWAVDGPARVRERARRCPDEEGTPKTRSGRQQMARSWLPPGRGPGWVPRMPSAAPTVNCPSQCANRPQQKTRSRI